MMVPCFLQVWWGDTKYLAWYLDMFACWCFGDEDQNRPKIEKALCWGICSRWWRLKCWRSINGFPMQGFLKANPNFINMSKYTPHPMKFSFKFQSQIHHHFPSLKLKPKVGSFMLGLVTVTLFHIWPLFYIPPRHILPPCFTLGHYIWYRPPV